MRPTALLILSCAAVPFIAQADPYKLEIRLLKLEGAEPKTETLKILVDDPAALVTQTTVSNLAYRQTAEVRNVTSYRFASEYTAEGKPSGFDSKDVGLQGSITVTKGDQSQIQLEGSLKHICFGTPRVYEVGKIQVAQPTFEATSAEMSSVLKTGEWLFQRVPGPNATTTYWAYRLTDSGK